LVSIVGQFINALTGKSRYFNDHDGCAVYKLGTFQKEEEKETRDFNWLSVAGRLIKAFAKKCWRLP